MNLHHLKSGFQNKTCILNRWTVQRTCPSYITTSLKFCFYGRNESTSITEQIIVQIVLEIFQLFTLACG